MRFDEDDLELLDGDVQDAIHKHYVEVPRGHNGFREREDEGADKRHTGDFAKGHLFALDLAFRLHARVAYQAAHAHGTAVEDLAQMVSP